MGEGNVLTRVCPSVCPQGGGGQVQPGGSGPARGVRSSGGVRSSWGGSGPARGGVRSSRGGSGPAGGGQVQLGGGGQSSRGEGQVQLGWGQVQPGGGGVRSSRGGSASCTLWRAVCLLRSRRRTFLFLPAFGNHILEFRILFSIPKLILHKTVR